MSDRLGSIVLLFVWIAQVAFVALLESGGRPTQSVPISPGISGAGYERGVEVENQREMIVYRSECPPSGRRRRGGKRKRRQTGQVKRRHRATARRRSKPRQKKAGNQAGRRGRQVGKASGFRYPVQVVVVRPDYSQTGCPDCAGPTKCKRCYHSHPQDINLDQPTILQVYREVRECCDCRRRIAPTLDFIEKRGRFTKRVKQKAIASVTEDGVPLERVPERMWRDFHVRVTKSTVCEWVHAEAEADLGEAEYTQWVVARFSGVVGIDEVHLRDEKGKKQYLVVAVDPINERTILFDLIDSRDSDALKGFLKQLKEMGIDPLVVITDMWKAYRSALLDVFPEAEQQLCVFHVIQAVMKHTNKALSTYRRGLPKETEAEKAVRKELWDCRYLLLKANQKLNDQQRERLEAILDAHRETVLPKAYVCKEALLTLFRESWDKEDARTRRDEIVEQFEDVPELKKVLNLIRGDRFERMIVYLDYENLDKTNNNAERENRAYQKGEKTRYRARKTRTRLNYVRLRARRRNQRSSERNDHLRHRKKQRAVFARRVDAVVQREARRMTA